MVRKIMELAEVIFLDGCGDVFGGGEMAFAGFDAIVYFFDEGGAIEADADDKIKKGAGDGKDEDDDEPREVFADVFGVFEEDEDNKDFYEHVDQLKNDEAIAEKEQEP